MALWRPAKPLTRSNAVLPVTLMRLAPRSESWMRNVLASRLTDTMRPSNWAAAAEAGAAPPAAAAGGGGGGRGKFMSLGLSGAGGACAHPGGGKRKEGGR